MLAFRTPRDCGAVDQGHVACDRFPGLLTAVTGIAGDLNFQVLSLTKLSAHVVGALKVTEDSLYQLLVVTSQGADTIRQARSRSLSEVEDRANRTLIWYVWLSWLGLVVAENSSRDHGCVALVALSKIKTTQAVQDVILFIQLNDPSLTVSCDIYATDSVNFSEIFGREVDLKSHLEFLHVGDAIYEHRDVVNKDCHDDHDVALLISIEIHAPVVARLGQAHINHESIESSVPHVPSLFQAI